MKNWKLLICKQILFFIFSFTTFSENNITISLYNIPLILNIIDVNPTSMPILANIYDPLLSVDENGSIAEGVAYKWEIEGKVIKFFLKDTKFSNGEDVLAKHFINTLENILSKSLFCHRYYFIKNSEQFVNGKVSFKDVGIRAISNNILEITLEEEVEDPILVWGPSFSFIGFSPTKKENINLSNGPWQVNKITNDKIVIDKNPFCSYETFLDSIEFIKVQDYNSAVSLFLNGEIDIVFNIPGFLLNKIPKDNIRKYMRDYKVIFLAFNMDKVNSLAVRKNISASINRDILCENILMKTGVPAYSFIPTGYPYIDGTFREQYGEKIFSNTIVKGKMPDKIRLLCSNNHVMIKIAQYIQSAILEKLNIKVEISALPIFVKRDKILKGDYDIAISGWMVDHTAPPFDYFTMFHSTSKDNNYNFANHYYDIIIDNARSTYATKDKYDLLAKAERILCSEDEGEYPIAPLYFGKSYYAINKSISGEKVCAGAGSPDLRKTKIIKK